jgi:hypothetical protein
MWPIRHSAGRKRTTTIDPLRGLALAVVVFMSACRVSAPAPPTVGVASVVAPATMTALATKPVMAPTATAITRLPATAPPSPTPRPTSTPSASGYSLRFYGTGRQDVDRLKIRLDPPAPADIGATDFTLEFWIKATADSNRAGPVECGANNHWINGNIVVDRDRFGQDRKFGLSLAAGRVVFGVSGNGTGDRTVCGQTDLRDGAWHHLAVQRRRSDGYLWVFVDGRLEAEADGPDGDISYPDGAPPGRPGDPWCRGPGGAWGGACLNDPFLVIGAEKHDADQDGGTLSAPLYPAFAGWVDELRLSNVLRYPADFDVPDGPFEADANTVALYHFDEGPAGTCTLSVADSSGALGGPSDGECRNGGPEMPGPEFSPENPFSSGAP